MPKLDVRHTEERTNLTLADVPSGEWWLDEEGTPYQREDAYNCVFYSSQSKTFCCGGFAPSQIKVTRKICDPIELIWE